MGEAKRRKLKARWNEKLGLVPRREIKMVKCKDCEFWKKHTHDEIGNCVRYPPKPMLIPVEAPLLKVESLVDIKKVNQPKMGLGMNFFFPMTNPDIECGDGRLRIP